ncbi:Cytochrome c oxidase subunit IV [Kytococcus aerolatus]|uniref:Cytochrome c oxidase polypeptide 4 n=1 Tax=Kytococcus aerolatus TaxID=592308 RepID=A0A212T401_9MICO|nr:cytochrome c oxidase subunit 4 [Kytococcus aerolatus]SNC60758.1 Cytochrome c oxidase subunit IV [Kytococcus aerolatus]
MKVETKLFWYLTPAYVIFFLLYGFWTGWNEPVGAIALGLSVVFWVMIAWYLGVTAKTIDGIRPEDDRFGHQDQVAGHYGHFAPYSWWPLWLSLACAVVFTGVAVGWWMFVIGLFMLVIAVVGWVYEYYSGPHHV